MPVVILLVINFYLHGRYLMERPANSLLTLIAIYAPASHRATWFALMASLMNLALTAGALGTKYLNLIFHVDRGSYGHLPSLAIAAYVVSFVLPLTAIAVFGRRVR